MERAETTITPYRNGPYLVRGPFAITDQEGKTIERRRSVIALCRCGRSKIKPFCDGTHKTTRFRAEGGAELPLPEDPVGAEPDPS